MTADLHTIWLPHLGVLSARGPDAARFLQGQLSNDTTRITASSGLLAGYHNPQGRVIAVMRLIQPSPEVILAILPSELVAPVISRLNRFVLRAKVKLADESSAWRVEASYEPASATGDAQIVQIAEQPARWLRVTPRQESASQEAPDTSAIQAWQALDIAAGIPQIYSTTSEMFVAQMINLDLVGGIAFDKGCYTGQEVIARTHYRGRVKRRMQRFRTQEAVTLARGESGHFTDGRSFKVVDCVVLPDGRSEFLAVAPLTATDDEPAEGAGQTLAVETLPLPYELPQ